MLKSEQIQVEIDNKNAAIDQEAANGQQTNHEQIIQWRNEISVLQMQLSDAKAEEAQQQERVQAQAEKVDSITLAYDYNEILGNPLANETIIENVKQFQLQAYEEHNAEVAKIKAEHADMLAVLSQAGTDNAAAYREGLQSLQDKLDAETEQARLDAIEIIELSQQVAQLGLEKKEAEKTRDNAAQLLAEANAEIEKHKQSTIENVDLRQQIEALKQELTAKKALTVSGNEKLAELAAKAKESTAAAAQRGIDRWNQQHGMDIPAIAIPEIQPVNPVTEKVEAAEIQPFPEVQTADSGTDTQATGNTNMEPVVEQTSEVITLESLKAEVDRIKAHVGLAA